MKNRLYLYILLSVLVAMTSAFGAVNTGRVFHSDYLPAVSPDTGKVVNLSAGDTAPVFVLSDQHHKKHALNDYLGKWLVLYFYPKDMTPGCTTEACNFRDSFSSYEDMNVVILGVSMDSVARHLEFSEKYALPFPLLSDEKGAVCEDYGVLKERSADGKSYLSINRSTFIIDPDGIIAKVYPKVDVSKHAGEVLEDIRRLRE